MPPSLDELQKSLATGAGLRGRHVIILAPEAAKNASTSSESGQPYAGSPSTFTMTMTETAGSKPIVALPGYLKLEFGREVVPENTKRIGKGGTAFIKRARLFHAEAIKRNGGSDMVAIKEYKPSEEEEEFYASFRVSAQSADSLSFSTEVSWYLV